MWILWMVIVTAGVGRSSIPLSNYASQQECNQAAYVLELQMTAEYGNDPWTHYYCAKLKDTDKVQ
jgi:hypothetical protein